MTPEQWKTSDEYFSTPDCSSLSLEDDHNHDQLFPFSSNHFHQIDTSSSPLGTSSISPELSQSPHPLSASHQNASDNNGNDALVANFDLNGCDATVFNADDAELYGMLAANLLHFDTANESGINLVVIANDAGLHPVSQGNEEAATTSSTFTTLSHITTVTPAHAPVVSDNAAHNVSRVEDKKERRKRQNREAAKKFRKNQQQQVTNLIKEHTSLKQQHTLLVSEVARLRRASALYEDSLQHHVCVMTDTQKLAEQLHATPDSADQ